MRRRVEELGLNFAWVLGTLCFWIWNNTKAILSKREKHAVCLKMYEFHRFRLISGRRAGFFCIVETGPGQLAKRTLADRLVVHRSYFAFLSLCSVFSPLYAYRVRTFRTWVGRRISKIYASVSSSSPAFAFAVATQKVSFARFRPNR